MKKQSVTIYSASVLCGITKFEGNLVEAGRRDYAQYKQCPYVQFIPAGKRKPVSITAGYKSMLLVLVGHGHPAPDPWLVPQEESTPGVTSRRSRYSSCDPRYTTDFNQLINPHLASLPADSIILDGRWTTSAELAEVDPNHRSLKAAS
jgi:hypothetical protein